MSPSTGAKEKKGKTTLHFGRFPVKASTVEVYGVDGRRRGCGPRRVAMNVWLVRRESTRPGTGDRRGSTSTPRSIRGSEDLVGKKGAKDQ